MIGLDVGTTAVKAVAFELGTGRRHLALREYVLRQPEPGQQVQDPDEVLTAVRESLAECVSRATAAGTQTEVLALSVSTAMHALIGLDDHQRPLTPVLTWADSRAVDESLELHRSGQAVALQCRTGTPVHPMSPLTKLIWFQRHEPELCARVRWWIGLKELVLHHLTGQLVTELSSASATGLLNSSTRQWDSDALAIAGISATRLPAVLSPTAQLPLSESVALAIGVRAGTPVVLGAADGPLGNLGTGAISPGIAGVSLGTSGAVRVVVPEPRTDDGGTLFCYALTESAWVVGGAISNGGNVIGWAGRALASDLNLKPHNDTDEQNGDDAATVVRLLAEAARVPPGSEGVVMLPFLLPERVPLFDLNLHGAFVGLRAAHTRGHLVRAAIEGVARQLAEIVERVDAIAAVTTLHVTGGAFRSGLWRQVVADMVDRPLINSGDVAGTARGAAALGLLGMGLAHDLADSVRRLAPVELAMERSDPDADAVATYRRWRATLPGLLQALSTATGGFGMPD